MSSFLKNLELPFNKKIFQCFSIIIIVLVILYFSGFININKLPFEYYEEEGPYLESHEPESHEPESHEPESQKPESHEPESHEPESHEPESHEMEEKTKTNTIGKLFKVFFK